jgi:DNA-directed RNA polymerase subunit RPC12/RpoP
MSNDESKETKMVPAICSNCGGQVIVDAQRENAFCQYCGTQFIVDKAINTYKIQRATIEHADSVNIVQTSAVESVLNFVKDQQKRNDAVKKEKFEEERRDREEERKVRKELIAEAWKEKKEDARRKHQFPRGCMSGCLVMLATTILCGIPAQWLDKTFFHVVYTSGSEATRGPFYSVAIYVIIFIGIIGFAYGWAPDAKIWSLAFLWIGSIFNRKKNTGPSLKEGVTSNDEPKTE